ncbi:putative transcription factor [Abeliophyllum distichum]|uniref:Transcription factor n=1 Tax=Abeliophyllum distichum TaxID=126358 RepID=A0ABD1UPK9_9LAMI
MAKESARKCKENGHDSRTCNGCTSIRIFGVQIDVADDNGKKDGEFFIRKSKSLGNLEACNVENTLLEAGYLSDGYIHQSSRSKEAHERKRGMPWSEEEHRSFLVGLEKLGKGDWKGIAKNYVPSRNSSQVASHAQKYFIRLSATEKKRRRSSVFDIPLNEKNASAYLGSPSNKAPEISQHAGSLGAALKNPGEFKGQASMQPPVTTSDKPPLSPMAKLHGITNFRRMVPYMAGVSCFNQGLLENKRTPTVSWFPIVNLPNQNRVFLPTVSQTFTTCAPLMPQPPGSILRGPIHQGSSSQASPSTGITKNNAMNLSIGKLEL